MSGTIAHRMMGGSPLAVVGRLLIVSLLVGAVMSWMDIDPMAIFDWVQGAAVRLWATGFQSLHQVGRYIVTGAALVVPVWLLLRLTSHGYRDAPPTRTSRWTLPGSPEDETLSTTVRSERQG